MVEGPNVGQGEQCPNLSHSQDAGLGVGPDVLIHMSSIVFSFLLHFVFLKGLKIIDPSSLRQLTFLETRAIKARLSLQYQTSTFLSSFVLYVLFERISA